LILYGDPFMKSGECTKKSSDRTKNGRERLKNGTFARKTERNPIGPDGYWEETALFPDVAAVFPDVAALFSTVAALSRIRFGSAAIKSGRDSSRTVLDVLVRVDHPVVREAVGVGDGREALALANDVSGGHGSELPS
jgi:hypothetical protein